MTEKMVKGSFGGSIGLVVVDCSGEETSDTNNEAGWKALGLQGTSEQPGVSVAQIGDITGDGIDDGAASARRFDPAPTDTPGQNVTVDIVSVIFGQPDPMRWVIELSATFDPASAAERTGDLTEQVSFDCEVLGRAQASIRRATLSCRSRTISCSGPAGGAGEGTIRSPG